LLLLACFFVAQALALLVGASFISRRVSVVENPSEPGNALLFFAYVISASVVLLLLLKFYKGKKLFLILEYLLVFAAVQLFSSLYFNEFFSLALGIVALAARIFVPKTRFFLLLYSTAVVGALLGASLDLLPSVLLASLLAGYDVIAVFWSKHMITLAKNLEKRGAAFSLQLKRGTESVQLGTGDVAIPAMVGVSSLKLAESENVISVTSFRVASFLPGVFALAGGLVGLAIVMLVLERKKGYWPALPPIVFGTLAGLAAYWLVFSLFAFRVV